MFTRTAVGLLLGALASLSHAALIIESYQIALTEEWDIYPAGHVFHLSATYDSAGSFAHFYSDGDNHIAEFGAGDDLLDLTDSCDPCADGESMSNAIITISGLLAPPGAQTPRDVYDENYAWTWAIGNPATTGWRGFYLQADSLALRIFDSGPGSDYAGDAFDLVQDWNLEPEGVTRVEVFDFAPNLVQRVAVPEPGTVALMGFGFAALVAVRKRQK